MAAQMVQKEIESNKVGPLHYRVYRCSVFVLHLGRNYAASPCFIDRRINRCRWWYSVRPTAPTALKPSRRLTLSLEGEDTR